MPLPMSTFRGLPELLGAWLLLSGCQGPQVSGQPGTAGRGGELVGQPYAISHKDAQVHASKASDGTTGSGGEIAGLICGSDLMMQVSHKGDHVLASGFIDSQWNAQMQIRETDGYLTLVGSFANQYYKLQLFGNRLLGTVGRCKVDLRQDPADEDRLVQNWSVRGQPRSMSLRGVNALWSLPPAEQAVLLPILVECLWGQFYQNNMNTSPEVKVGGAMGALPRGTINWSSLSAMQLCNSVSFLENP